MKELELDMEKRQIRKGLAQGIAMFFGILMLANLIRGGALRAVIALLEGLLMVMFMVVSYSRRY